jgi:hypothetical protein
MAHFKLETEISGLKCSFNAGEELEFLYKSFPPVIVKLRQLDGNDEAHFARTGNAICTAATVKDIEPEIKAGLDSCLEDGHIKISKLKPDTLRTIDEIFCPLRSISRSTIVILNWSHGLDSPPNPYGRSLAFYSEDGSRWLQFARATTGRFNAELASRLIYARDVRVDEVVRKVELGCEEPLGRQLFREAWQQIEINPRGALVIGVAAAEVGLKGLISTLLPGAEWLVQELQAPPVRKILRDFLPTLPVRARWVDGSEIKLPSKLISEVVKAFELRNKVVHVGALPPNRQELATTLQAISDLLWICDVLLGEHWAMKHVSLQTKKNWPSKSS